MLTYADLNEARVERLTAAADEWQRLTVLFTALAQDTTGTLTGPLRASKWGGDAATAAFARLDVLDDEFEVAASRARIAAIVLRSAVDDFTDLQQRLRGAADGARAAGLIVSDTGAVSAPYMGLAEQNTIENLFKYPRNITNAGIYNDLIAAILAEARDTDQRIAAALTQIGNHGDFTPGQDAREYNQTTIAAQSAATALGLSPDAIPGTGSDPATVKTWWDGLSADQRQLYLQAWPDKIGALDGLPALDRDTANQQALRNYIGANIDQGLDQDNHEHDRAMRLLNRLETAETEKTPMFLLGFDPRDDGQAIVAIGNPDTAAHTAVIVPGVGTELDEFHKEFARAGRLYAEADRQAAGAPVSVIAWLGYDTPGGGATGIDIASAPFGYDSETGARKLDTFIDGLRTSHDGPPSHITGIGHSYGSTVYGEAAGTGTGIAVDDLIVAGSPGMRVDQASDLSTGTDHTWATAAQSDNLVARPEHTTDYVAPALAGVFGPQAIPAAAALEPLVGAIHGPAPHEPEFGANVLHADSTGHSGYWNENTDILKAQAAVVVGDYDRAKALGREPGQ